MIYELVLPYFADGPLGKVVTTPGEPQRSSVEYTESHVTLSRGHNDTYVSRGGYIMRSRAYASQITENVSENISTSLTDILIQHI
jgi:hypothetical protein